MINSNGLFIYVSPQICGPSVPKALSPTEGRTSYKLCGHLWLWFLILYMAPDPVMAGFATANATLGIAGIVVGLVNKRTGRGRVEHGERAFQEAYVLLADDSIGGLIEPITRLKLLRWHMEYVEYSPNNSGRLHWS